MSKCDVGIGIACYVESLSVRELPWVAIGRADHREHQLASGDRLSVELDVGASEPKHPLQGRNVPQHLLNGGGQQFRGGPEPGELFGVFDEGEDGVVEQVGGGLTPGQEEQLEEPHDLWLGESLTFHLGWTRRVKRSFRGALRRASSNPVR